MRLSEAYEILGIAPDSDISKVKAAYRKQVLIAHPDRGGSAHQFIRVQAAYEIICESLNTDSGDASIEVPAELREIIDDLVRSFRMQFARSEETCARAFGEFDSSMRDYLSRASRSQLREFGDYFRRHWNELIVSLFAGFNHQSLALIRKYESWFDQTMEETFAELHRAELRRFGRSPRFYAYAVGLLGVGLLAARAEGFAYLPSFLVASTPLVALPVVYWADCTIRRKRPCDVQTLHVQLFQVDQRADFQGSYALRQGASNTVAAGLLGASMSNRRSHRSNSPGSAGSSLDPLVGLAVGLALGAIVDRIIHPTAQIRAALVREYQQLMAAAQPRVTQYVVERHQALMNEIRGKIEQNYEKRMRKTVLLLTGRGR